MKSIGKLADELGELENDSEDEGIEDYKEGGYHVVFVGECLIGRYVVLQKLGWGHFSTVWLCMDLRHDTYVAIKIQKSASHYLEAAFDEVEILQKAVKHSETKEWFGELGGLDQGRRGSYSRDDCYTVQLLNAFIYIGPYGKHFCMVFEILGVNLLEIIKRYKYKGIPIHICRKITRQILIGLHYLHSQCGIIHTDLKPENVMLCLNEKELDDIINHRQLYKNEKTEKRLADLRANISPGLVGPSKQDTSQEREGKDGKLTQKDNENKPAKKDYVDVKKANSDEKEFSNEKNNKVENLSDAIPVKLEEKQSEKSQNLESNIELNLEKNEVKFAKKDEVLTVNDSKETPIVTNTEEINELNKEKLIDDANANDPLKKTKENIQTRAENSFELMILTQEDLKQKMDRLLVENNIDKEDEIKEVEQKLKQAMLDDQKKWQSMTNEQKKDYQQKRESIKLAPGLIELQQEKQNEPNPEKDKNNPTKDQGAKDSPNSLISQIEKEPKKSKTLVPITNPTTPRARFNEDAHDLKVGLSEGFKIKIADLGNGCWTHYHFQPEIQTRQYRGPEVILGINYNETADVWSLACMVFEMLTGDFLFDPKKSKNFRKNDDHLAQMVELLNEFPADCCTIGTHSKRYFDCAGKLKKIKKLRFWGLKDILVKRYKMDKKEAQALEDFLLPMLRVRPQDRASAKDMINHYWLDMPSKSFKSKTPIFKPEHDKERFEKIINASDEFADVSRSEGDDEELKDPELVIEGSLHQTCTPRSASTSTAPSSPSTPATQTALT